MTPVGTVIVVALLSGCSLASNNSCAVYQANAISKCLEWDRPSAAVRASLEATCQDLGGDFGSGSCPTADREGGCRTRKDGTVQTTWYYAPSTATAQAAQGQCSAGDLFVPGTGQISWVDGG